MRGDFDEDEDPDFEPDPPRSMTTFNVGDVLEHVDGPRKGRRVRVVLCLYDRYALRSVSTNRLSYVRVSVLRSSKHYKLVEAAHNFPNENPEEKTLTRAGEPVPTPRTGSTAATD